MCLNYDQISILTIISLMLGRDQQNGWQNYKNIQAGDLGKKRWEQQGQGFGLTAGKKMEER